MADKTLELALRIVAEATGKQHIEQLVTELRNIEQSADAANPAAQSLGDNLDNTTQSAQQTSVQAKSLADVLEELGSQQDLIHNFERSKQKLEQHATATAAASQALDELKRDTQSTEPPTKALTNTIEQAERSLAQMRDELTQQTTKHAALQGALRRSDVDSNNLKAAKRDLGAQFDRAGKSVDKFTQDLKEGNAAQQAHAVGLSNVTGQIAALAAAYFGLDRVSQAVSNVFATGDKFEKLQVQMNGLMGSISQGEDATRWIADFTKNTPLQLGEVSQAFVKLKAFGLDPMDGTLQAITDSALKLGGSYVEVEGISLALGQAWAKQKLQGEEILQLVERGVPVWDMLQDVTGKNVEELQKLSSEGKLGRDVIKGLIDEMGRASAGSAAAQMSLFSGQVSNARDNLEQFYNMVAQSGAMDWLKGQLTELNNEFSAMAADGRLQEWAQAVSDTIVNVGTVIKNTITTLYDLREEIGFVAKAWLALKVGSYFSNVVSGAATATRAFVAYRTAITSATVATNAATAATNRWKSAVGFIARGGLYTLLINELINVGVEYNNLLTIEQQVEQSRNAAIKTNAALAYEIQRINETTGMMFETFEQAEAAIDSGIIVLNELTGVYEKANTQQERLAQATKDAEQAERERQAFLSLTIPEALRVVESLDAQSKSLNGVRDGVDGFLQSLDSARTALTAAGDEYSQQITLLDELKTKFESHNKSLERQAYLANDVEKAYEKMGLKSSAALQKTATELQGAFELIQQYNEPIGQQQLAFLKWADAAIEAAAATNKTVPASVEAAAAALGLTTELDKLINKANELAPVVDTNSEAVKRYQRELDATKKAIAANQQVLASSTATAAQKAQAQYALIVQQQRLAEQTTDLNRVQQLELATMGKLRAEQSRIHTELDNLNNQYQSGKVSAQQYTDQKARLESMLKVVSRLLGDFKNAQDSATAATQRGTQATIAATQAAQSQMKSLREQRSELERTERTWYSTRSASNSRSNRPTVETIVDYQEGLKSRAYEFDSREVRAERERRAYEQAAEAEYNKFKSQINNASSTKSLSDIYKRLTQQLTRIDAASKKELLTLINQQRGAIKNQSSSGLSGAYTRQPTPNTQQPSTYPPSPTNGSLETAVRQLVNALQQQYSNATTVKLQLSIPGGEQAEFYAQIKHQLLDELEQLARVQ
ncbi:tape measure protein [Pseudoalteromonas umbrosa]|uniref:tape measure protein n=1 Tax=Pseudoalteromonas umbrosa TaxID=3048489 RepID=UPI0024C23FE6|nr:tape measure protein [Pseudoalteromonas sp. B95]MDK1288491.1 tape measure protein [Pseudoalteromonas sp. B95]